ncbi:hypothetical protein FH039_06895 [Thermococcus indicus]|uniref:Uncharacterized protein n=1 Tax=Thermococcus indicus TaxID=2586643 RepID=A0A4Y5SKG9_9EURY|nr:hypothetical protein [Thermococcus indicus]QDA31383.1 hypothetical protein FH039_06895 [Thermococcus indicus]
MKINKNNLFLYFLGGILAAITPWTSLLIGVVVYIKKNRYYSAFSTSVAFLLGGYLGHFLDIFYWVAHFWPGGLPQRD